MLEANYKFARDMAKKILKDHKITTVPTNLELICERLGLQYVELDDPNELDGAVIEMGDGTKVAMLNKAKPLVRARFTLAHELGHIFLHHSKRDFYDAELAREQAEQDYSDRKKPSKESEADAFASELLVPTEQLKRYISDLKDVEKMAGIFLVSKQVMSIAINNFFSSSKNFK